MKKGDTEFIKLKIKRVTLSQIRAICNDKGLDFEYLINTMLEESIRINQADYLLRKEILKCQQMRLKFTEIYAYLGKKPPTWDDFYVKTAEVLHFYADLAEFLRKKNFTESEILGVNKIHEAFKYLKTNYPEIFEETKSCLNLQSRTKAYKALFGSLGLPNKKLEQWLDKYNIEDEKTLSGDVANNSCSSCNEHKPEKLITPPHLKDR